MSHKFDTALDDCMDLLRAGASEETCLARYAEHAEELRPLLSLAYAVKAVPTPRPDPAAVQANHQRIMDAVEKSVVSRQRRGAMPFAWLSGRLSARPLIRATLILSAVVLFVSLVATALFTCAAESLPGQALYPVKRFGENVRLAVTFNPAARQELQTYYLWERVREVKQVLDAGTSAILEFRAEIEEIGSDYWIVGGLTVLLDDDTLVEGSPGVGAIAVVHASTIGDGTLRALRLQIQADPMQLTAVVTATPTSTPTLSATSTPTPTPSATVTPTAKPSPTTTVRPTHTEEPEATDQPEENETKEPEAAERLRRDDTDGPEPTDRPDDDETDEPEPTDRPDDDETDEPEPTDHPDDDETDEPEPTDHPEEDHTDEPEPTDHPEDDDTNEPEPTDHPGSDEADEARAGDHPDLDCADEAEADTNAREPTDYSYLSHADEPDPADQPHLHDSHQHRATALLASTNAQRVRRLK